MTETVLDIARRLRAHVTANPGKPLVSSWVMAEFRIPRSTALLLLQLLTYALLTKAVKHRVLHFTPTEGGELPPIAKLIQAIQEKNDKYELGVLTPEALAAVFGYEREAAQQALQTAGVDFAREALGPLEAG